MASPIEANWKKGHQDYRGDAQMNRLKAFAISSCLGLLAVAFLPSSRADEWNKKTVLTVNEQIAIPGAVLEPGKYVMKLADSQSNRSRSRTTGSSRPAKPSSAIGKCRPGSPGH
jgi:hypothetical protein